MNSLVAASLFDSPLVLLALLLFASLSSWLTLRRQQREARDQAAGDESPPLRKSHERAERGLDVPEVLRRLLEDEPLVRAPQPPPTPRSPRDAPSQESWLEDEPFRPEREWPGEPETAFEPAPPVRSQPPTTPPRVVPRTKAPMVTPAHWSRQVALRPLRPTAVASSRRRYSRDGAHAIELVRNARTVRQAFVASLVFGPPKAIADSHR